MTERIPSGGHPRTPSLPQRPEPQPELPPSPTGERSPTRPIALGFTVSMAASIGLGVVYALGGQVQLEGLLLFFALGGIASRPAKRSRRRRPRLWRKGPRASNGAGS
ncbi:MAG: hypothetical protein QOJ23_138 [Actinomycetota bacterium]|nr:hypothetical protein [Actinomycetota bacterium]